VTASGQLTMRPETFSGSVSTGNENYPLSSVNRYGDKGANHLKLYTPVLGTTLPLHGATLALLQPVAGSSTTFTVASIHARATTLPLLRGQSALVGQGDADTWLATHLHPGTSVEISERIAPDNDLVQAVGGGPILLKDGAFYRDRRVPAPGAVNVYNPLTAVGISNDGRYALFVVCNGRRADSNRSRGFTYAEMADYLLAHNVYQAMIFDGGGSSELVAHLPGQNRVSVINAPSAGQERLVANGLFVYGSAPQAGEPPPLPEGYRQFWQRKLK
ncbi:MAG: phosphodiester glycosidase family protein, partial [Ktedonobacteraceae bacterium]